MTDRESDGAAVLHILVEFYILFVSLRCAGICLLSPSLHNSKREGYRWAPSRHNRKKGCWLLVLVSTYFELMPRNVRLTIGAKKMADFFKGHIPI